MRLKSLLTAAMLIASPVWAQQQPSAPLDSPLIPSPLSKDERRAQGRLVEESTPSVDTSPGSIARVRAELEKPPPILTPSGRKADFSVLIEKRVPLQEIFESPPWATSDVAPGWGPAGSRTSSPPLVSFDVLPLLLAAKRANAEHSAREEVKRAIADYCAAQPGAGAGIQICATASAAR